MKIATKKIANGILTLSFSDGKELRIDPLDLTEEIRVQAMLHGLSQKLGDAYANAKGDVTWAYDQASEILDNIKAGDWNRKATGDGGILADAVAEVQGISRDDAAEKITGLDDETKAKLRKHPKIAAVMARIKAERAAKRAADSDDDLPLDF